MRRFAVILLLLAPLGLFAQLLLQSASLQTVSSGPVIAVAPSIGTQPSDLTVVTNSMATFTLSASGTAPLVYGWLTNGVAAASTSNSLVFTGCVLALSNTSVQCIVTNAYGSATSGVAHLYVTNGVAVGPSIAAGPTNYTTLTNTTATFAVAASGTAPLSYQWQTNSVDAGDGGEIGGSTTSNLTFTGVTTADSNTAVRCIITNAVGSVTSAVAYLYVAVPVPWSDDGTPTNIVGAYGWYVGASYASNSSQATWTNSWTGPNLTNLNSSRQYWPTPVATGLNSRQTVRFNLNPWLNAVSYTSGTPHEVVMVLRVNSTNSNPEKIWGAVGTGNTERVNQNQGGIATMNAAGVGSSLTFQTVTNKWMMVDWAFIASSSGTVLTNNVAAATGTTASSSYGMDGFKVGASDNATDAWDGEIAEIATYQTNLTAAQRTNLWTYYTNKYGLTR